tara:strand:- start:58629 stop:59366 length:738 start_codon:yes stop_codon:yes gene_type:complete
MGNFLKEIPQLKELTEKGYDTFIETGTYEGSTPLFLVEHGLFKEIHTIELSPYHYLYSTENIKRYFRNEKRNAGDIDVAIKQKLHLIPTDPTQLNLIEQGVSPLKYGNVTCYLGESPQILSQLIDTSLDTKFVVWLDAHYSAGHTWQSKDFGVCPLLEELKPLRKLHNPPIIIMDDANEFGLDRKNPTLNGTWRDYQEHTTTGYPNLSQVFSAVKEIDESYEMDLCGDWDNDNTKIIFTPKKIRY